jgi:outer membrane lipoprotein SlyB
MTTPIRKTHPMLLIAAVAVTIFSILGSATIAGLIPRANSEPEPMSEVSLHNATSLNQSAQPYANDKLDGVAKPYSGDEAMIHPNSKPKSSTTMASANSEPQSACSNCGVIESIKLSEKKGEGSGIGVIAGGVAGGLLGNQIGGGKGNTLMTVLGVGGGAYAGNEIEKHVKTTAVYKVKVRMADGTYRTLNQKSEPSYAVGDRVKVVNGHLADA